MTSQAAFVDQMKQGCQLCHQMGNRLTREITHIRDRFDSTAHAWDNRIRFGQRGVRMIGIIGGMGRDRTVGMFADWTDRIAAGAVPPAPPRPQGRERNVVITMWDWGHDNSFVHDEVTSDKRNPRVNANGPVYGVSMSDDMLVITDPVSHRSTSLQVPVRDPATASYFPLDGFEPSPFWGDEPFMNAPANVHNPMMDGKGRVWMTSSVRPSRNAEWCGESSDNPSARYFPIGFSGRQASYFDPATQSFVLVDTCYGTHHLQFAEDADDTLWFSGDTNAIGWLNTRLLDETGDERGAQGWCPTVLDTNGDGVITKPWNEPRAADSDPGLDTRIAGFAYGIIPNPVDGSVWIARTQPVPGQLIRLELGDNPPETCKAEVYEPPFENDAVPANRWGYAPRGIDVARDGVIWTALSGSGHLASFDRTKCTTLRGPTATGQHCPEGWTLYPSPGPQMQNVEGARQRRLPLLRLGRPVRHAGARREHADRRRHDLGRVAGARPRLGRVDHHACAVSPWLLHTWHGWARRQPEHRLEGPRRLGRLRHTEQLAPRGRQGNQEQDGAVSDEAASAGELARQRTRRLWTLGPRRTARPSRPPSPRGRGRNRSAFFSNLLEPEA